VASQEGLSSMSERVSEQLFMVMTGLNNNSNRQDLSQIHSLTTLIIYISDSENPVLLSVTAFYLHGCETWSQDIKR
jgi:hypothetical protein